MVLSLETNNKNENQHMQSPTPILTRGNRREERETTYTLLWRTLISCNIIGPTKFGNQLPLLPSKLIAWALEPMCGA